MHSAERNWWNYYLSGMLAKVKLMDKVSVIANYYLSGMLAKVKLMDKDSGIARRDTKQNICC